MTDISDEEFQKLIDQALSELPGEHVQRIENIAILFDEEPTPEQRATRVYGMGRRYVASMKACL